MPYFGGGGAAGATDVTSTAVIADNAIVRGDGGARLIQDSALTIADAAASNVTVATTAGNALTVNVTAPAAAAGASQVGRAANITASAAVASTDTAGAAAGGSITLTPGNAARNTSGNAAGGDVIIGASTGIGTGIAGGLAIQDGALTAPSLRFASDPDTGMYLLSSQRIAFTQNGVNRLLLHTTGVNADAYVLDLATGDTVINRVAANIAGLGSGDWLQLASGHKRVASNATNATVTMGNLTDLTVTLIAGRKYSGKLVLYCVDDVAAEGIAADFDGGTATMTSFRAHGKIFDTALLSSTQTSAIATDFAVATVTGDALVEIDFSLVCNAGGTFIPRFAQNAHTTGTATVYANSFMMIEDMP